MKLFRFPHSEPATPAAADVPAPAMPTADEIAEAQAALRTAQQARADLESLATALQQTTEQADKAFRQPGQTSETLAALKAQRDQARQELEHLSDQRVEADNAVVLAENRLALAQAPGVLCAAMDAAEEHRQAKAAIEEAQRQLAIAQQRLERARVLAPQAQGILNGLRQAWTLRNRVDPSDHLPLDNVIEQARQGWARRREGA